MSRFSHQSSSSPRYKQPRSSTVQSINILRQEDIKLDQIRQNTFSNWPLHNISAEHMVKAGFFYTNNEDRVICISCNLICHRWSQLSDDPCEVHRILSPDCLFVNQYLRPTEPPSIINRNNNLSTVTNFDSLQSNVFVSAAACHPKYFEIPKRQESFDTWPLENLPSVDDLVRAGFFYTGTRTIVTCFYCNGSLQYWGPKYIPMIEHAHWFPHCAYAKQLCGDELYRKIQESKRPRQERAQAAEMRNATTDNQQLCIQDESTLANDVAIRLERDISYASKLLFGSDIVKKCWEDQLRLKKKDFASDFDLYIACSILQKQIEYIDVKKKDIIIPSESMRQHRERVMQEQAEILSQRQPIAPVTTPLLNPCVVCLSEEKTLACIPCGHLIACIPCGTSLRSCAICRRDIDAFVRIYL